MSERFSKAEIKQIVEDLVEELRECDNGTVITTWQLLKVSGYDMNDFEQFDLFDIHSELFKAARAEHITLDMSAHKNKLEGLSYNLDYIVKNKRAQIKCPYCGSINTARYIYGYPAFSERMQKKLDSGKWELGGCCISGVEINGQVFSTNPTRRCNDCKKDFGKPPIIISKKKETIEDIRDIVTSINFSVGGFFQGHTDIIIKRNDKGALVTVEQIRYSETPAEMEITTAKWDKMVNTLYGPLYLNEWEKDYVDNDILDGTQWSLKIKLTNNRKRTYYGSNDYPPYWNELLKLFRKFAKI